MRRLKTLRRPPIYPKSPGHLPCSSLTHPLPLPSRRPSVSFGGFGLKLRGEATLSKWADEYYAVNPEEKRERDRSDLISDLPPHLNTPYLVSSQTEPYFWGPISVKLDREQRLYVAETNRHRIQVYQKR